VVLQPGESKLVSFEATPTEARTYQVSVDGLTGSFAAIQPAPAKFEYASDIRKQTGTDAYGRLVAYIEVDIKNIGGSPGSCTAAAFIRTSLGSWNVPMGTKEINPGGVVAFFGTWEPRARPGDFDWLDYIHITSEAGPISFAYGRRLKFISYEPAEITPGTAFTPAMTLLLPYQSKVAYYCWLSIGRNRVINVTIGAPDYTYNPLDRKMYATGTYTLTGAKTSLPPGIYDVKTRVIKDSDRTMWTTFVFYDAPVGKLKVI